MPGGYVLRKSGSTRWACKNKRSDGKDCGNTIQYESIIRQLTIRKRLEPQAFTFSFGSKRLRQNSEDDVLIGTRDPLDSSSNALENAARCAPPEIFATFELLKREMSQMRLESRNTIERLQAEILDLRGHSQRQTQSTIDRADIQIISEPVGEEEPSRNTDITDAHNRAIAWVLHQKTYTRILHSILGWEPICERFYFALLTLKHNSTDNPHLFPRLPNIPLLSQFRQTQQANTAESPLAWKQWLKQRRIHRHDISQHRGALITTRDSNGTDMIMQYRVNKSLQIHLIY